MIDSADSNALKTTLWSVIKSAIKSYLVGLYVVREAPAGLKNGSNTVYTLTNSPVSGTEMVFLNGMLLNAGAGNDYTISGAEITLLTNPPTAEDVILVTYRK